MDTDAESYLAFEVGCYLDPDRGLDCDHPGDYIPYTSDRHRSGNLALLRASRQAYREASFV